MNDMLSRIRQMSFPAVVLFAFLTGCTRAPAYCSEAEAFRAVDPESYAENDQLPFQFPLENPQAYTRPVMTNFQTCGWASEDRRECHAAEDYYGVPGTPVFAFADGEISFSGRMGGYGWLIIVDHPQFNLYSLYGHLSPSRWQARPGPVEKGELIGYLGDDDENGGTPEQPLIPHLHFGIRVGQRTSYPGNGEWRWMAGWIAICPEEVGWMQPSQVIAGQGVPEEGLPVPTGNFFEIWWFPLVFGSVYLISSAFLLLSRSGKQKPLFLVSLGVFCLVAGRLMFAKHLQLSLVLIALAAVTVTLGGYRLFKNRHEKIEAAVPELPIHKD